MKKNATKKELIQAIAEETNCTQHHVADVFQKCLDAILDTLVTQGRIELRNFGIYEVKKRKARVALNPRTGEKVMASEKYVVTFTPGKKMSERLNERLEEEKKSKLAETSVRKARASNKTKKNAKTSSDEKSAE